MIWLARLGQLCYVKFEQINVHWVTISKVFFFFFQNYYIMLLIHHEFQHPCYFIALSMSLIFSKSIITFMFKTLPYFLGKNLHVCSFSWTKRVFYQYRSYKKCIVLLGENFNSSYKVSEPLFFVTFCSVSMRFFTFSFENMLLNISKT